MCNWLHRMCLGMEFWSLKTDMNIEYGFMMMKVGVHYDEMNWEINIYECDLVI